jgi:predicted DNA-binding transcriptional regulator AlpA
MDPLVGLAEMAEMLGISNQRVHQLAAKASFPAPVVVHSHGRAWKTEEIKK